MRNINQLNEAMVVMQTNIASNDLTLKTINGTLQNIDKLNETMVIMHEELSAITTQLSKHLCYTRSDEKSFLYCV